MFDYLNILSLIALSISVLLIAKFYKNLFLELNGYLLVLLGYSVFIFLDITKSLVIRYDPRVLKDTTLIITTLYSFLSFILFLIGYHFFNPKIKLRDKQNKDIVFFKINYKKLDFIIKIILFFAILYIFYLKSSTNNYILALSFIQKSAIILSFFAYLKSKKLKYLYATIILTFLSFSESSRRVYINVFIILLIVFLAYLKEQKIEIQKRTKIILSISFIVFFVFLNYLRSEHNFGIGYIPNDKIKNTINYITTLRSIDTFFNTGYTIETVPGNFDYLYGRSYLSLIFGFVPRAIWSEKPLSYSSDIAFRQRTNYPIESVDDWYSVNQYSLSPGFVGEAYANFGIVGVIIISYLFGVFTKYFDSLNYNKSIFANPSILPYLAFYPIFILLLRGDFYAATIFSIQLFIFLKFLLWLVSSKTKIIRKKI